MPGLATGAVLCHLGARAAQGVRQGKGGRMEAERIAALVIGAGPAGLMAAEALARAGHAVIIAEARPSPARKLLMAGKTGLNLTRDEPRDRFLTQYSPAAPLAPMIAAFGPEEAKAFCRGLGQEVFTGTTGRVFPVAMKASPLVRAWLARLAGLGVTLRTRWRWSGWDGGSGGTALRFETPDGPRLVQAGVTVLALGGASWTRLGSDGAWVPWLQARGVPVAPWAASNHGLSVAWSPAMAPHFGAPVKPIALMAAAARSRGEIVISARGIEGGGLYPLGPSLRAGADLTADLVPDITSQALDERLARQRPGETRANRLRKLGLSPAAIALAMEFGRSLDLAQALKALPIAHAGPRPLDEAISTAGGIAWEGLGPGLEVLAVPGLYAAGEMLDWEAPTGGYLLTACLATGLWAGRAAAALG